MTYLGTSQASVSVALASVTLLTTGALLGASAGPVSMTAAAVTLTTTGGPLGSSVGAGGLDCAALDLAMTTNFQGSVGAGRIVDEMRQALAIQADFLLNFTDYDGTALLIAVDGGTISYTGAANVAPDPAPLPSGGGWYASTVAPYVVYNFGEPGAGHTLDDGVGYTLAGVVNEGFFAGSDDVGFITDAPLWSGIQEVTFATGTGTGILRGTEKAMSLWEVGREVYSLWGYEIADLRLITYGRESIVNWCNAAMQLIYSNAHRLDYFNRDVLELTVTTSGTVALPANVQLVQGPARIGTAVLSTLASRAEYDHFAALYVGDSSLASPIAFYVEPLRGTGSDSVGLTLNLAPLPTGTVTVRLDVTLEPPRYDVVDLMQATILQLPHKWAETIFLPIVRKWACADSRMGNTRRQAVMPQIDEQFAAAKQMLGLADIEPPAQSKTKPEKQGGAA